MAVEFLSACSHLDLRTIRRFAEAEDAADRKVVASAVDPIGQNGLHFVCAAAEANFATDSSHVALIGYLKSLGVDVDKARTSDGWTPLILAAVLGRAPAVTALLAAGADANVKDADGMTAEDWAKRYKQKSVEDLLLHHRSKVPKSRFSCVVHGPALPQSQPKTPSTEENSVKADDDLTTTTTASEEDALSAAINSAPVLAAQ